MKVLVSFKVQSLSDIVEQIGQEEIGTITVADITNDPATPYFLESREGGIFISFGIEEGNDTFEGTFTNALNGEYSVYAKPHVIEYPDKMAGILFGGHPVHKPHG